MTPDPVLTDLGNAIVYYDDYVVGPTDVPGFWDDKHKRQQVYAVYAVTKPLLEEIFPVNPEDHLHEKFNKLLVEFPVPDDVKAQTAKWEERIRGYLADPKLTRQDVIHKFTSELMQAISIKEQDKHGMVYTPPEVVSFILKSVDHILKKEFNLNILSDEVEYVIDPFVGTGTFPAGMAELWGENAPIVHSFEIDPVVHFICHLNYDRLRAAGSNLVGCFPPSATDTFLSDPINETLFADEPTI